MKVNGKTVHPDLHRFPAADRTVIAFMSLRSILD
jgi:hypothetical protein